MRPHLLSFVLLLAFGASATQAQRAAPRMAPATVQVTVGGEGLFGGVLADYLVTPQVSIRSGFSAFFVPVVPLFATYHVGARRSRLEVGGGALLVFSGEIDEGERLEGTAPAAWVGYRRQPGPGGLLLRAGVLLIYSEETLLPLPGVAVGLGLGKPRQ